MADQSQEPNSPLPALHPFVREHLGLLLGASPLVLVAIRFLQISKGDPAVAAALLQTANVSTVVLSTLTAWLPLVLFFMGVWMVSGPGSLGRWMFHPSATVQIGFYAWVILFGFLVVIGDWLTFLILVGGMVGLGALNWWIRRSRKRRGETSELAPVEPFTFVLVITLVALIQGPWFPAERIALETGTTRVGYVLNPGQEPTTVLWREGGLVYLKSTEIKNRQPCREGTGPSGRLLWLTRDETPNCPTAKVTPTLGASQKQ